MEFKTGTLVEFRNRPWVVLQSGDPDILNIKPLGGIDAEIEGLYLPLYGNQLKMASYEFKRPSEQDLELGGYQQASRLLYNACRLSFRDIAGPFQSLGRLSFEPRPYQMVPLILALRQERIRLMISDDVGIGKTLESLLIVKELLDRHEIDRFSVICLPHLCEQWQNEIKDKFGLDAEIVRSSTVSRLEKKLRSDQNVFRDIPFQVISIDYIKQKERLNIFLDHCPDILIVDEAHTCAKPKGANNGQQLRYNLLHKLAERGKQLILLTATPHSGKLEEFQSLIGLLDPKFENWTLETPKEREELSKHFIQRRRADIAKYLKEDENVFPVRRQLDRDNYDYSDQYCKLLLNLIDFVKSGVATVQKTGDKRKQRYMYWDLLALMRGVMSSPDAGISMLRNKIEKASSASDTNTDDTDESVFRFSDQLKDLTDGDDELMEALEKATEEEKGEYSKFIETLENIKTFDDDAKVKHALRTVKFALDNKKNPIVFCQYIQTAEYVGNYIKKALAADKKYKKVAIETITSKMADEERKIKIEELSANEEHVLICTDCLSEGVNLQNGFECIIHYDLPWNPNRMEQRNGRIDRFGQTSPEVYISTMFAQNSPIDDIVLNVLYKKQEEIRKQLGVYMPIAENDASLMETIMQRILTTKTPVKPKYEQPSLFSDEELEAMDKEHEIRLAKLADNEKISHTYYAHNNKQMDPTKLKESLEEAKSVIGGVEDTRDFVVNVLTHNGVNVVEEAKLPLSYHFLRAELPAKLRTYFKGSEPTLRISFASPTPKGYRYIGRNHVLVEDLARSVINDTINGGDMCASRAMVMETDAVATKTTVLMMRVRSVIRDKKLTDKELVGEEMIFIGYRGNIEDNDFLSQDECKDLFLNAKASGDTELAVQKRTFKNSIEWTNSIETLRKHTDAIAVERANHLVSAFTQYRSYLNTTDYQVAEPVLPMDVIAAYVFTPKI